MSAAGPVELPWEGLDGLLYSSSESDTARVAISRRTSSGDGSLECSFGSGSVKDCSGPLTDSIQSRVSGAGVPGSDRCTIVDNLLKVGLVTSIRGLVMSSRSEFIEYCEDVIESEYRR